MERNNIVLFQSQEGQVRLKVKQACETVWLRQEQIAELFGKDRTVIGKQLAKNAKSFSEKTINYYSLDKILQMASEYALPCRRGLS